MEIRNNTGIPRNSSDDVTRVVVRSVLASLTLILLITSAFANIVIIIAFAKFKKLRTNFNIYLLHLSVSDLFLAMFSMSNFFVFALYGHYPFGFFGCAFWIYCDWLFTAATANLMMLVSLDRLASVYYPMFYRTAQSSRYSRWFALGMWSWLNLNVIPAMLLVGVLTPPVSPDLNGVFCTIDYSVYQTLITASVIVVFWVPESVTVISYILIAVKMRRKFDSSSLKDAKSLKHGRSLPTIVISKDGGLSTANEVVTEPARLRCISESSSVSEARSVAASVNRFRLTSESSAVSEGLSIATNGTGRPPHEKRKAREQKERKTFQLLSSLVVAVLLCCVPAEAYHFLSAVRPDLATTGFYQIAFLLTYFHCILNPVLYHAGLPDMKKAIHQLFAERWKALKPPSTGSSPLHSAMPPTQL